MRRDQLLLTEMITASERIVELTSGRNSDALARDDDSREALLWNFTVLGEAASQLSDELTHANPAVEWEHSTSLRNRIVHGYWSIDLDILVTTGQDDIPRFLAEIRQLILDEY